MSRHAIPLLAAATTLAFCSPSLAQFETSSDGSDGAFAPVATVEIDLALAATATWDTPSPVAGQGVYDPDLWVVVFKYTTVDIPVGITVTFANHPSGAPVVWLTSGDVTIDGTVNLDAQRGHASTEIPFFAEPGPGGFAGGRSTFAGGGGFGPGGSDDLTGFPSGGSYGTPGGGDQAPPTYGNDEVIPLIGGSGGSVGPSTQRGAGSGGGAIFIASETLIDLQGTIRADGSLSGSANFAAAGKGSGGAIRLRAPTISGPGSLRAVGGDNQFTGDGGDGRIRLEADQMLLNFTPTPAASMSPTPSPLFPPTDAPTLEVVTIAGLLAPTDPDAGVLTTDLTIDNTAPALVEIAAENIPPGTVVEVRVVPEQGAPIIVMSDPLSGTLANSTTTAMVTFPRLRSDIQLRAVWTP